MKVAVVGLGYVGAVTAPCPASRDHDVWGVDVDPTKIDENRPDRSPVAEPHLERLLTHKPTEASWGAGMAIVSSDDQAVLDALCMTPPRHLMDLTGRLGSEAESLPGCEGLGW